VPATYWRNQKTEKEVENHLLSRYPTFWPDGKWVWLERAGLVKA